MSRGNLMRAGAGAMQGSRRHRAISAPANTSIPVLGGALYAGGLPEIDLGTWTNATSFTVSIYVAGGWISSEVDEATAEARAWILAEEGSADAFVRVSATGPGGTVSSDSAAVTVLAFPLTSLIGRWEMDQATLVGGNVTALVDRGAQGNDLAIGGAGAEITLVADADYGGQLVGVFAAGKTLTRATFTGGAIAQPTTVLWLGEFASLAGVTYGWDGPTTRQALYQSSGGAFVFGGASLGAGTLSTSVVYPTLTVYNGASSQHYRGSDWSAPAYTGNAGTNAMNGFRFGARDNGTAQMTGRIAIGAAWSKVVDAGEIAAVVAYLNAKYGQAITV